MAELPNVSELLRRATLTNIGFYEGLVEISAKYLKNLSAIFDEAQEPVSAQAQPAQSRTKSTALVLEAEAGERAEAYFVVENQLTREVTAEIIASPIVNANGEEVEQKLQFEPPTINLKAGERIIVQVAADIYQGLEPGAGYRGSITVPGLSDSPAAIVIRRLHADEESDVVVPPAPRKAKRRTTTRKKTTKKAARKK